MLKLLLVDDESHWTETLEEMIDWQSLGIHEVYRAVSGAEAIERMTLTPIDILITDVKMPQMSGIELIEATFHKWPRTRCLVLSGYNDFDYAKQALRFKAVDYLLKPVRHEEVITSVRRVVDEIQDDWTRITSQERTLMTLREHLPLLRSVLLNDLVRGRVISPAQWQERSKMLQLPLVYGEACAIVIVRLEEEFQAHDYRSMQLMEYAVANMAEEIMQPDFRLWHSRDERDYLIFVVQPARGNQSDWKRWLSQHSLQLQQKVRHFLKGSISIMVSDWGEFPLSVPTIYEASLHAFRQLVGGDKQFFIVLDERSAPSPVRSMTRLYDPPTLVHLLETSRWEELEKKLGAVFDDLSLHWSDSQEHVFEAGMHIGCAYAYLAHKNGAHLSDWIGDDYERLLRGDVYRSIKELRNWSTRVLGLVREKTSRDLSVTRADIVRRTQAYAEANLASDISLQALADRFGIHPNYLSRVYKQETGEGLSDYIYRHRMEKALVLLRTSNDKVYEIGERLGYESAAYFIKVFKRCYGMTPQEMRDRQGGSR
jgi:two-component system response regulator YesN